LNAGILQLEPQRKVFASSFRGEPLDCVGGVVNDLAADSRGGAYVSITGGGGLFYANPQGVVSQYGQGVTRANGIVLSGDERTLFVTNGAVVLAFDVQADGALTSQREFGKLRGGQDGDGSAVDEQGRVYVPREGRSMSSARRASSSAASRDRKACTARLSGGATRRRSSAGREERSAGGNDQSS
jgi:hypothetical protein